MGGGRRRSGRKCRSVCERDLAAVPAAVAGGGGGGTTGGGTKEGSCISKSKAGWFNPQHIYFLIPPIFCPV